MKNTLNPNIPCNTKGCSKKAKHKGYCLECSERVYPGEYKRELIKLGVVREPKEKYNVRHILLPVMGLILWVLTLLIWCRVPGNNRWVDVLFIIGGVCSIVLIAKPHIKDRVKGIGGVYMAVNGLCTTCQEMSDLIKCSECGGYYCVCCYNFEKSMCRGCVEDIEDAE